LFNLRLQALFGQLGGGLNLLKKQVLLNFVAWHVLMPWLLCMSVANSTSFVCGNKRKGKREREREKKKTNKKPYLHTHAHIFFLNNLIFLHKVHSLNRLIDIYGFD
jgi:hypothetical protein